MIWFLGLDPQNRAGKGVWERGGKTQIPKSLRSLNRSFLFTRLLLSSLSPSLCLGVNVYKSDVCIQQLDDDFVLLLLFYILFVSSLYILAKLRPRLKLDAQPDKPRPGLREQLIVYFFLNSGGSTGGPMIRV